MIKSFLAKYLIEIFIGALVVLAGISVTLYIQRNSANEKLKTEQANVKAIDADRERIKNLRDEATAKNLQLTNAAKQQNESIERAKIEAEKQKLLIVELQAKAKQQAAPHYTRIEEIKAVPLGVNTCDNLKAKIDTAIKPYTYF